MRAVVAGEGVGFLGGELDAEARQGGDGFCRSELGLSGMKMGHGVVVLAIGGSSGDLGNDHDGEESP